MAVTQLTQFAIVVLPAVIVARLVVRRWPAKPAPRVHRRGRAEGRRPRFGAHYQP